MSGINQNPLATMVSIGLAGFSGTAAATAVETNLTRCLWQLAKREVDLIVFGGPPLLFNLGRGYSREFAQRCDDEFGIRAVTSIDAVLAAFRSLQVNNVVVINKWDDELNGLVASTLEAEGIQLAGAVTEVHTAGEVKARFEEGVDVALRLTEKALTQYPSAECLFIAGGAWLVAPFISQSSRSSAFRSSRARRRRSGTR